MLSIVNHTITMTDALVEKDVPPAAEVLEDGEIDEEDEIVTEEIIEESNTDSQVNNETVGADNNQSIKRSDSIQNDDNNISEDDRKKSHKKHQRKRKKHRDSREKELKKRKKRKMHSYDENMDPSHEHGSSLSPHSKRRKKRKKHSRDRKERDSTTPDSDDSVDQYQSNYYNQSGNGYGYTNQSDMYASMQNSSAYNMNNSSSAYYANTMDPANTYQDDGNNYESDSGSDFEAQLAEYQNYKTHGDSYATDSKQREKRKRKKGSSDMETSAQARSGELYEEFMEYDENPKRPCKFFAEGNCLKGNECGFSHDQDSTRTAKGRLKKREMCKYYLAGHCHHGNQCSYMHGDYPCKYFHTGATCYAGENCRFSHDPPTDETKDIIESFKDVLGNVDDSWEISELQKLGIEVRPKPPPGVGLLPTPDIPPLTANPTAAAPAAGGAVGGSIPSLFEISVAPTADFQKRIHQNSVVSLSLTDESEGASESGVNQLPPAMYPPPFPGIPTNRSGRGLLPAPNIPPNLNYLTTQQDQQSQESDEFYDNFYEGQHAMEVGDNQTSSEGQIQEKAEEDVIKTDNDFIRIDNSTTTDEERTEEHPVKAPDFLPATQKALFMRIHGKRTSSDSDKDAAKKLKEKNSNDWTYSSDEDEKTPAGDSGIIKMDTDAPSSESETSKTSTAAVESLIKLMSKGGNPSNLDANLLSKVASVINMPTVSAESYNPASSVAMYNPAQTKSSPHRKSTDTHHRQRKTSESSNTSPGHSSKHHRPNPIRRRLSTQELTKEPIVIPLVPKQNANPAVLSSHPDPRLTQSRLVGVKMTPFSATLPKFSKDLILPGPGKVASLKGTLSSEESKVSKRDPRLGRHKDPRLQRSSDPRLKSRGILKSSSTPTSTTESKPNVPSKPSALLTKSSVSIPSLPELDLNLAHINQQSNKENGDSANTNSGTSQPSYALPNLKLPKLVKAPGASPDAKTSPVRETAVPPPTIAPYDPRYMSSGTTKQSGSTEMPTAPYDPRVLSGNSSLPAGMEVKKRTIQLPKLTPAPTYKPSPDMIEKPEGDQGDF